MTERLARLERMRAEYAAGPDDQPAWLSTLGSLDVERAIRMEQEGMEKRMPLVIIPCSLDEANAFVRKHHRHHRPVPGAKFCIGVAELGGEVRGVAIVGRPVARMLDDGWTLEVNRTCTDGAKNANSMLYGSAWRAAKAMGYKRLITYTLKEEGGASLRAAGWKCIGQAGGGPWSRASRPRVDTHPLQTKLLWEAV